ncbi:MAG TPA: hypothetical protein VE978_17405 [Chitinophagales bacterium]|nr:hypothetical protein [Chitinophagales bacterium]
MLTLKQPLSNIQQQLLKLYAAGVPDDKLEEVSELIAKYLLNEARDEADKIWLEKNYGEEQLREWLHKTNHK